MIKGLIDAKMKNFETAVAHFADEAAKIRTGRANPALVENILIDYYGTKTALKQIATINIPEARQILIQPWDKGSLVYIESAIRESNLGANPNNDGQNIRITLPSLTEDRRKEFVKILNQRAEEGHITIRTVREEIWKDMQELERGGSVSEDDKFKGKDELQKIVDAYNQKVETIRKKKEEEILIV